jgi:membrane associated rhomboid family serine protease
MFFPYRVDVPMARWPIANFVLIGITVLISFAMFLPLSEWAGDNDPVPPEVAEALRTAGIEPVAPPQSSAVDFFLLQPNNFRFPQLVGSLFIHAGLFHLLGNMLFLFVFGNAVNAKIGHASYIALYLGIGIMESIVWLMIGPGNPILGASGAIMGIVGVYLFLYPLNEVSVGYLLTFYYRGVFQISGMWLIAIYVAFDIWGLATTNNGGIGYLAHVAGFCVGAAVTWLLLKYHVVEMDAQEKSLLQVWGLMPHHEDVPKPAPRPKAPMGAARPAGTAPAMRPPPPPRPKRDEGPIPLD